MKIIELLTNRANNEKGYPHLIKYEGFIYHYDREEEDYIYINDNDEPEGLLDNIFTFSQLNDEVDVIGWTQEDFKPQTFSFEFSTEEEDKKIENPLCCHIQQGIKLNKEELSKIALQNKENIKNIYDKLVEIIEVLNER